MILRPVPGFPDYEINRAGEIFSIKRKKFIKPVQGGLKKYPRIELWKNKKRYRKWIHRINCEVWVGPVDGKEVHHRDGISTNFHADNLIPLTKLEHLEAQRKLREKQARIRAKELKESCPF